MSSATLVGTWNLELRKLLPVVCNKVGHVQNLMYYERSFSPKSDCIFACTAHMHASYYTNDAEESHHLSFIDLNFFPKIYFIYRVFFRKYYRSVLMYKIIILLIMSHLIIFVSSYFICSSAPYTNNNMKLN